MAATRATRDFVVPTENQHVEGIPSVGFASERNETFARNTFTETREGLDLKPKSRHFGHSDDPSQMQLLVVNIPVSSLSGNSIAIFNESSHSKHLRNVVYTFLDACNRQRVGHPDAVNGAGAVYPDGLASVTIGRTEYDGIRVFVEIVENASGTAIIAYRLFFTIQGETVTWADMLLSELVDHKTIRRNCRQEGTKYEHVVANRPHLKVKTLTTMVESMRIVSGIHTTINRNCVPLYAENCRINPVNMLNIDNAMFIHGLQQDEILELQRTPSNYFGITGKSINFPMPDLVREIPREFLYVDRLSTMRRPLSDSSCMARITKMIKEHLPVQEARDFRKRMETLAITQGQRVPEAPEEDPSVVDEDFYSLLYSGLQTGRPVTFDDHMREELDLFRLRGDNEPDILRLAALTQSPSITEEKYEEITDGYLMAKTEEFWAIYSPHNTKLTKAARAEVSFNKDYWAINEAKGTGIIQPEDIFLHYSDSDPTMSYDACVLAQLAQNFEDMGAINFHCNLILMYLMSMCSPSLDASVDNLQMIFFGPGATGKSWSFLLFIDHILLPGTASNPGHQTRMVNTANVHSTDRIFREEEDPAALGILDGQGAATGDHIVKRGNQPKQTTDALFITEQGDRTIKSNNTFRRWVRFAGCNERNTGPDALKQRSIAVNITRTERPSRSAHENQQSKSLSLTSRQKQICKRFHVLEGMITLTRRLIDTYTLPLPNGISCEGAVAVMGRFKGEMRKMGYDIDSNKYMRSLSRMTPIVEAMTILFACCKVQNEMANLPKFNLYTFSHMVIRHLWISHMSMRWTIQLCAGEFTQPMLRKTVVAISEILKYSNNAGPSNGGHIRTSVSDPMDSVAGSSSFSMEEIPVLSAAVQRQRMQEARTQIRTGIVTPSVKYAVNSQGQTLYDFLEFAGTWGQFYRLITDKIKSTSSEEPSEEHIMSVCDTIRSANISCYPRTGHRQEDTTRPKENMPVCPRAESGKIWIRAAYIDKMVEEDHLDRINEFIMDIDSPGSGRTSTISATPIKGYPFLFPRVHGDHTDDESHRYYYKNINHPPSIDKTGLSDFAAILSTFGEKVFAFTDDIDFTVHMVHLYRVGQPPHHEKDYNSFPHHIDAMRKCMAYAKMKMQEDETLTAMDAMLQANEIVTLQITSNEEMETQVSQTIQTEVDMMAAQAYFKETYPAPQIVEEAKSQALNLLSRKSDVHESEKQKVTTTFHNALDVCGIADCDSYKDIDLFGEAEVYLQSLPERNEASVNNLKRGRDIETIQTISGKRHKQITYEPPPEPVVRQQPRLTGFTTFSSTSSSAPSYAPPPETELLEENPFARYTMPL